MSKIEELSVYLKTLRELKACGYKCEKEIAEAIREMQDVLEIGERVKSDDNYVRYKLAIRGMVDSYAGIPTNEQVKLKVTNKFIYDLYKDFPRLTDVCIGFERGSGVTTSIAALIKTFDDVYFIVRSDREAEHLMARLCKSDRVLAAAAGNNLRGRHFGGTVFVDDSVGDISIKATKVIRIKSFEV
ncbi:hypothetical protein V7149_00225 [Bacillus sp. JJ1503]|uniref:hypothetical protein n=1 Tax=Bacillus sp. JJ1503 TaxID=3122956 RepID=UPI002FFEEFED